MTKDLLIYIFAFIVGCAFMFVIMGGLRDAQVEINTDRYDQTIDSLTKVDQASQQREKKHLSIIDSLTMRTNNDQMIIKIINRNRNENNARIRNLDANSTLIEFSKELSDTIDH